MLHAYALHEVSTKSNSSQTSSQDDLDFMENQDYLPSKIHFEIDVKPKKKKFDTLDEKKKFIQDYKKKIKTELCKTFMLKGSCRYGNKCSFAHGPQELKEKSHLNTNFKTRPCRQYFLNGMCPYGYRCQYLHRELKYVEEFREFLISSYKINGLSTKEFEKFETERERLIRMEDEFKNFSNNSNDVKLFLEQFYQDENGKRLGIFKIMENDEKVRRN